MRPLVIVAPLEEPISIDEARAHIEAQRYDDSDVDPIDDAMIEGWIGAAREHCENFLGLSLSTRTLEIALDSFPVVGSRCYGRSAASIGVDLPMGPVREVVSVIWGEESDEELAAADFVLDLYQLPNRIMPVAASWPSITAATNAVKIRYVAGYGVDSDGGEQIPRAIRAAMLLLVGHMYAHREDASEASLASIPNGAMALLRPLRVRLGMA